MNAIIAGAGRGLGAALAIALAERGYNITLISRTASEIDGLAEAIGERAVAVAADVSTAAEVKRAVQASLNRFGPPDALLGNAAILGPIAPIETGDIEQWLKTLMVNVFGAYLCLREVIPLMRDGAQALGVSSGAALSVMRYHSAYNASKAAFEQVYRHAAAEHPRLGIAILDPGGMDTAMMGQVLGSDFPDAERFRAVARPRLRRPQVVAEATVDLLDRGVESGKRYHIDELVSA
jgi:NAD(P)-dependent dehydrogenase (short-subunit alcohol dehydrogenase family)